MITSDVRFETVVKVNTELMRINMVPDVHSGYHANSEYILHVGYTVRVRIRNIGYSLTYSGFYISTYFLICLFIYSFISDHTSLHKIAKTKNKKLSYR